MTSTYISILNYTLPGKKEYILVSKYSGNGFYFRCGMEPQFTSVLFM
jgi:hypothetical protein